MMAKNYFSSLCSTARSTVTFCTFFILTACVVVNIAWGDLHAAEPLPLTAQLLPDSFDAFVSKLSPLIVAQRAMNPKHYRQIEPSLYYFLKLHEAKLKTLPLDRQIDALVKIAEFIDCKRESVGHEVVIGAGHALIGLLDPARGLEPKEITTIATGYGATTDIFKQDQKGQSIRQIAHAFLAAVADAAASGDPTTIVVLGHGAPEEIQSYSIPFGTLADALIAGAIRSDRIEPKAVDLCSIVLICDDCYSADFLINLAGAIEVRCRQRELRLISLPFLIAGTNRDRVGHADVGEKFVPHFWREVIELFYVRQPRPKQVTLRDFFENVDNRMYSYGRTPIVKGSGVVGYRVVDAELFQDPVIFVPLSEEDLVTIRTILDLNENEPLLRLFDIG